MVSKFYIDTDMVSGMFINEKDYLKVVEEKEYLGKRVARLNLESTQFSLYIEMLEKELNEKDEEIKRKKNDLITLSSICNEQRLEIKELKKKIIELELGFDEETEETWTLSYSYYDGEGNIKQYKQSGLLKEEYEEMYGMDSDNWISHSLFKDRKDIK